MTRTERLTLINQYEILKHLNPQNTKDYENKQTVLSSGYELLYSELELSIDPEPMSAKDCQEVHGILNLYRAIKFSSNDLSNKPKGHWTQFRGFDANEEPSQFAFALFERRDKGLWAELEDCPDNSHAPTLDQYREMLRRWEALGKPHKLTALQIDELSE